MKRLKLEHADWHVTARGARRLLLFHEKADYDVFYALLGESCRMSGMGLIADCLMSNHFHLALAGGSSALTRCMHRLNRAYSGYHNDRYDLSGHAFDKEYFGKPILSEFILKRVVRYIHLNPVRGGQAAMPENYPWSSYQRMIKADDRALAEPEKQFLGLFGADLPSAQRSYGEFTQKDLARRPTVPVGRSSAWEIWQEQFTWILDHAMEQESLLLPLPPEAVASYLGSRIGIPPRAMGKVLNHPNGRQVSEMVRALERRLERSPYLKSKIDALNVL
ncbi:MAG TPA: transposase [Planctomycetota bacterium]|nr:transposase [Planctomycetota bacterium]